MLKFDIDYNKQYLMPTLKELGNQAFKSNKYKEAIKYYDEYVQEQHADNKNAFFNLGLCFSKIGDHQKSIQACKSALALDAGYQKAYYRLMKEYFELGSAYEVFINALHYIKTEKDTSSAQIVQARQFLKQYKERFISKSQKIRNTKKLQDNDAIFKIIEPLNPILENNPDFNEQIDKYPNEWIDQWSQEIQSEDAKWQEIAYIIKELDYHYGLQLAYFYVNQMSNKQKKQEINEKIKEIKAEMNLQEPIFQDCYDAADESETKQMQDQVQEPQEQNQGEEQISPAKGIQVKAEKEVSQAIKPEQQPLKQQNQMLQPNNKPKNIQDLLQMKSENRKIHQQTQDDHRQCDHSNHSHKQSKPQPTKQTPKIQKNQKIAKPQQKPMKTIPKIEQVPKKEETQLEQLYKQFCGNLQKTKDIFTQIFKSIFSILNGKEASTVKGDLLILIKKRVKKFKIIISSFSDNQQRVILDLLKKSSLQEYAVDFAPAFYKA